MDVAAGTIVMYGDIACPWAHLATHRLLAARERLGIDVAIEMRAFPLEIVNGRATPYRVLQAEIPVVGRLDPAAGWQMWQREAHEWPVTTLLALEAMVAAGAQGRGVQERLAAGLRRALFAESRCVSMRHVILDIAERHEVDVAALSEALDTGTARATLAEHTKDAIDGPVEVSPHLFLPDGTDVKNPGIAMHWVGDEGEGFPVVDRDDPAVYDDLLRRARRAVS